MDSVFLELEPPAPKVTLIKEGLCAAISCTTCCVFSNGLPGFGGNISQETVTLLVFKISEILISHHFLYRFHIFIDIPLKRIFLVPSKTCKTRSMPMPQPEMGGMPYSIAVK